jgi:hypothetical protein
VPDGPFDLKTLQRNWLLAERPGPASVPAKIAAVPAPLDPFEAARVDLARLRQLIEVHTGARAPALELFVKRVEAAIASIDSASRAGDDPAEARLELDDALADLEDLLEVSTAMGRRLYYIDLAPRDDVRF